MPDEKLMKSVFDLQKTSDDRPYRRAIEEIARAAQPMAETLRAIQKSSVIGQLNETLRAIKESSGILRLTETARFFEENS